MTDSAIIPAVDSGTTQQISGANLKTYFTGNIAFNDDTLTFPNSANTNGQDFNAGSASASITLNAFSPDGNTVSIQARGDTSRAEISAYNNNTSATNFWYFDNTGNVTLPGSIVGTTTITIDNRGSGSTADVNIYAADDILLQARDRTSGIAEGGDINILAGDGGNDTEGGGGGGGGDIEITGGKGGAGNVDPAGTGGFVRIRGGDGGDGSVTAQSGAGNGVEIIAGDGGEPFGGGGNAGGDVEITAGDTTNAETDRGSIILTSGDGGTETTNGGYVEINIPQVGTNPGGSWTFTGYGTVLNTPPNAEIFGASAGNITVGSYGNTIVRTVGAGLTTYDWVFDPTGVLTVPGNIVMPPGTSLKGSGASPAPSISGFTSVSAVELSAIGNITGGNISTAGNVTVTGNLNVTGTTGNVVTKFESSWTVVPGTANYSFTVDGNNAYQMWVEGNIPNGIIVWNATVSVTNTNVPVIGQQFAWNYEGGGNILMFTSIPNQIIGTAGAISNAEPVVSNTNVFTFGIDNDTLSNVTVTYGWVRIS